MTADRPRLPLATDPPGRAARTALERVATGDRFHDYVLGEYVPLADPRGKLRAVNVLIESFAIAGVETEGLALVNRIRARYGAFRTVWGAKWSPTTETLAWELYFYDFDRAHADCSLPAIRAIVEPCIIVDAEEPRPLPWHMFSIEFGARDLRDRGRVPAHVYIDMRSYALTGRELAFENVYTFHDATRQTREVLHRLESSVHIDATGPGLADVLPPELFRCATICVANKRVADAVYASRIPTKSLRWFIARHGYPAALRRLVDDHAQDLDHLYWCVGADIRRGEPAAQRRTGIYGSF